MKLKSRKQIILTVLIAAAVIFAALVYAVNFTAPKDTLTSEIPKLQLSASEGTAISLGTKGENANKDNEITKAQENKDKQTESNPKKDSSDKSSDKNADKNSGDNSENNPDNNTGKDPGNQNGEDTYEDLAEDAYAESSLDIENLMKEIGIEDENQIIYAKCITGPGEETLLQAVNGIYSLYLSTQGTTIIQIKYKDSAGATQTYTKKITYKRPEGSTPDKKKPIINCSLKDQAVYTNNPLNFDIWVTNYRGKRLSYNNVEVYANGSKVDYVGQMDQQTYRATLNTGANTIKIKITDSYQYTVTKTYTVYYKSGKGKITISLEAGTIGIGYLIKPVTLEIESGLSLAQVVLDFLDEYGYSCDYAGSTDDGFYLSKINKKNMIKGYKIPNALIKKIDEDGLIFDKNNYESLDCLGEFDFCQGSGWMYSINGTYSSYGFDKAYVQDGDVVRIRFTLAYGKDIGGSGVSEGMYGTLKDYGREW